MAKLLAALSFFVSACRVAEEAPLPGAEASPPERPAALCDSQDIFPVIRFGGTYTDVDGRRYHRWLPPAGPPFYELCDGQPPPVVVVPVFRPVNHELK